MTKYDSSFSFLFFFFFWWGAFWGSPVAYGGSQARVQLELQLPAYASTTATWDLSHIFNLQLTATPDP